MGGTRCQALEVHIALGSAVPEAEDLRRRLCRAPSGGQECGLMFPVKPSGQGEGSAQTGRRVHKSAVRGPPSGGNLSSNSATFGLHRGLWPYLRDCL